MFLRKITGKNSCCFAYKQEEYIDLNIFLLFAYNNRNILTGIYSCCLLTNNRNIFLLFVRRKAWYIAVSIARYRLFSSKVGLETYQHLGKTCRDVAVLR